MWTEGDRQCRNLFLFRRHRLRHRHHHRRRHCPGSIQSSPTSTLPSIVVFSTSYRHIAVELAGVLKGPVKGRHRYEGSDT